MAAADGTYDQLELQQIDEATYEDVAKTKKEKDLQKMQHSDRRRYKRALVGAGLLCGVLVLLNIAVPLYLNQSNMVGRDQCNNTLTDNTFQTRFEQLMTRYTLLTEEKDQIQTKYNQLTGEKEQILTNFNTLTKEKGQLQTSFNTLTREKGQLQTSVNTLTREKGQLQTSFNTLTREKGQLQTSVNTLTREKGQLQTSFNTLTREKEQLQTSFNTLTREKGQLQTSVNTLTKEKGQLQTNLNTLTKQNDLLQSRHNQLTEQKDELQTSFDQLKKTCDEPTCQVQCESGWQKLGSNCYFISTWKDTWENSRQCCLARQSDMIVINSKEEQDFAASFNKRIWLGLTDRDIEGSFQWVDGTPLTTPTYWMPGEPRGVTAEDDCVEYYDGSQSDVPDRGWNEITCSGHATYWICERAVC